MGAIKEQTAPIPSHIGVRVTTRKSHMCNSKELDDMCQDVKCPLPEMVFGGSHITVEIRVPSSTTGEKKDGQEGEWCAAVNLNAQNALSLVRIGPNSHAGVEVHAARHWKGREGYEGKVVEPYDWTYSSNYRGSLVLNTSTSPDMAIRKGAVKRIDRNSTSHTIDVALLQRPDPIIFWDDVVLFEDELGDSGMAIMNARIRVMPKCFFILLRSFIRVDGVLFRVIDTRLFHRFGTNVIVREFSRRECPFDVVKARLQSLKAPTTGLQDSDGKPLSSADSYVASVTAKHNEAVERRSHVSITPRPMAGTTRLTSPLMGRARSTGDDSRRITKGGPQFPRASGMPSATMVGSQTGGTSAEGEDLTKLNDVDWVVSILVEEGPKDPMYVDSETIEDVLLSGLNPMCCGESPKAELRTINQQFTDSPAVKDHISAFTISKDVIELVTQT